MKKILVIEDEPGMLSWLRALLKSRDFEVIAIDDGLAGMQAAVSEVPDLIISDIMLDNANGFIIRQELQENPVTRNIPYIFMTGAADVAGAWEADDSVQYLTKPFSAVELMEAIRKQIG